MTVEAPSFPEAEPPSSVLPRRDTACYHDQNSLIGKDVFSANRGLKRHRETDREAIEAGLRQSASLPPTEIGSTTSEETRAPEKPRDSLPPCPYCLEKGEHRIPKNPSDQRKHEKFHTKPHKCQVEGCEKGFASANDLERHTRGRHGLEAQHSFSKYYRCALAGCPKAEKIWDRKDNFKAHLERMHKHLSGNEIESFVEQ